MIKLPRLLAISALMFVLPVSALAQRRDYLTAAELELVQDAQELDLRIKVLTHATDRRLAVLNNEKLKEKDSWGPPPQGTRLQLLSDIDKLVQKAVDDIDEVAARNRTSKLLPRALHKLADSCREYLPKFKSLLDATTEQKERGPIIGAASNCESVIEAAKEIAAPEK
jgi:hypothetical protein